MSGRYGRAAGRWLFWSSCWRWKSRALPAGTSPRRLLQRLQWMTAASGSQRSDLARQLQGGPPKLKDLLARLQQGGWRAQASGIAPGQFRTNAPWPEVFAAAKAG